jgi:diaminohydroxyphosphoribosylaminopyrimidine deaminase / 5-amino-6-(5-phosphoribosylamino)uracil reductase
VTGRGAPTADELELLARARALAEGARGRVSPNPLVGAIVVREGGVVGEGRHEGPGTPHAEVMALRQAGTQARGATVVCTLEPCSHHGRTPPCTDALLEAGVARVVVGTLDPLERDRAGGDSVLRAAGVEVALAGGQDAAACREQNSAFITWALTGRPEVTLKLATSLDGRIATAGGESRWITGAEARRLVHRWRAESDAVGVGIGTALADDPRLTARDVEPPVRQPTRVVFDSAARLPLDGALARTARELPVIVVCADDAPVDHRDRLAEAGVEVVVAPGDPSARIDHALAELGRRGIQSLLVEGGAGLAGAMVAAGTVDRVAFMLAPMLIGDAGAPGAIGAAGVTSLAGAPRLGGVTLDRVGDDVLIRGRLRPLASER